MRASNGRFISTMTFTNILCQAIPVFNSFTSPVGLPLDILGSDFWTPGSTTRADSPKYAGKPQFKEILKVDLEVCHVWVDRAIQDQRMLFEIYLLAWFMPLLLVLSQDFQRKAPPESLAKTKDGIRLELFQS